MTARTEPIEILVSQSIVELLSFASGTQIELTADRAYLTLDGIRYVAFLRPTAVAS